MIFKPKFRHLPPDFSRKIRLMDGSPLILVKVTGEASFANSRTGKDQLVGQVEPSDLLLFAWVGQWKTDVFVITQEDLEKHYDEPDQTEQPG